MYTARINFLYDVKRTVFFCERSSLVQEIATSEQSLRLNRENNDHTRTIVNSCLHFRSIAAFRTALRCVKLEMQHSYIHARYLLDFFRYLFRTIYEYLSIHV